MSDSDAMWSYRSSDSEYMSCRMQVSMSCGISSSWMSVVWWESASPTMLIFFVVVVVVVVVTVS